MTTIETVTEALAALKRAEREHLQRLDAIRDSIRVLSGLPEDAPQPKVSHEYRHLGIVAAATCLLREVGHPLSTRELVDGMGDRGWVTRAKDPAATVYATLNNAPRKFSRTDGAWSLREWAPDQAAAKVPLTPVNGGPKPRHQVDGTH